MSTNLRMQEDTLIEPRKKGWLLGFAVKFSITTLILYIILSSMSFQDYRRAWVLFSPAIIISVLLLIISQICLLAFRWYILASSAGSKLSIRTSIFGILMSFFFSQGLPASVGADAFRIWWHKREGMASGVALKIIFFDRICGMLSLVLLCSASVFLLCYLLVDKNKLITLVISIATVGFMLGLILMPWRFGISRAIEKLSVHLPQRIARIALWMVSIRNTLSEQKLFLILILLGTGIVIHLLAVAQVYIVGEALSGNAINLFMCLAVVPPALFVSYLPFSIAGWGVREASMVLTFGLVGIPASMAILISLSIGMAILFISLIGGFIWLVAGFRSAYKAI